MFLLNLLTIALVAAEKHFAKIRTVGTGEPSTDPKSVKIATWNMYDRMNLMKENQKERFCFAVNDAFVTNKWDVVMMQEVFDTDAVLDSCPFSQQWHTAVGPTPGAWVMINSGLLIMSKYLITAVDFHKFDVDNTGCTDALAGKGVLFARIAVGGGHLFMFDTHIQGLYHSSEYEYKTCKYEKQAQIRREQIKQIFIFMSNTLDAYPFDCEKDKLFFGGDLNIDPWGPNEKQEFPTKEEYNFVLETARGFSHRWPDKVLKDISTFPQSEYTYPANANPKEWNKAQEKIDYLFRLVPEDHEPKMGMESRIVNPPTSDEQRAHLTDNEWVRNFQTFSDHKAIEYSVQEFESKSSGGGFGLILLWIFIMAIIASLAVCLWKRKKQADSLKSFTRSATPRRELLTDPLDDKPPGSQIPPLGCDPGFKAANVDV